VLGAARALAELPALAEGVEVCCAVAPPRCCGSGAALNSALASSMLKRTHMPET
jgi:hypothetical protein